MILVSSNKKKRILFALAGILIIWVIIGGVITPIIDASGDLDRKIIGAKLDLQKITEMADKYISMTASLPPSMRTESTGGPIISTAENISRRLGIEKSIERMTPSQDPKNKNEEQLSVTITSIPYPKFIDLLQGLQESGTMVVVKRAKITTTFDNKNNVGAELTLMKAN
jgi:hypothetical protein